MSGTDVTEALSVIVIDRGSRMSISNRIGEFFSDRDVLYTVDYNAKLGHCTYSTPEEQGPHMTHPLQAGRKEFHACNSAAIAA